MPVKADKQSNQEKPLTDQGLRKIQFGSMEKKKPERRAEHPLLPDPQGQYATIATRIIERSAQVQALSGALEVDKAEIKTLATPFYFSNGHGKLVVPSSVVVHCPSGQVLITYQDRYGRLDSEERLLPILGQQAGRLFRQAFTIEIDGDKLPSQQAQGLLDQLQELFTRFRASDALKVREVIRPVSDFHKLRHTLLTPDQNLAIEQVCPIIAMVKVKARE
jgi:hypothetical protein